MPAKHPKVAVISSHLRTEEKRLLNTLEQQSIPYVSVNDRTLCIGTDADAPDWDVAINRSISSSRRLHVSRLCEFWQIPVVNSSAVLLACDDKFSTSLALARAGLATPLTAFSLSPDAGLEAIETVGYPAIIKPVNGSWGRQLAKVNDRDAAEAVLAHRRAMRSPTQELVYAQEFVATPGYDIRAIVVDNHVVGAIYRRSDHWIRNATRSSEAKRCSVTRELAQVCVGASIAVGGGALAVDLLTRENREILVNEVNSTIGFVAFEKSTGIDVAAVLVQFALQRARGG